MKNSVTQIVLLGGGYVSVWAYRSLLKTLRNEIDRCYVQITVICPEKYHFFHGWTAESLTGIIQDQGRMSPLSEIFKKANLINGKAEEINPSTNTVYVRMEDGSSQSVHYDHLLLGIGSFDNDNIEGLAKFGYQVKSHQAFTRTKQTIRQIVELASRSESSVAQALLSFTIAGGGFTGVELATNMAEFINLLKKQYPSLQNVKSTFRLVISTDRVLNVLHPRFDRIIRYAEKTMMNYDIEIIANKRITKVCEHGAYLNDGSFLQSSMVISTIGQSRIVLRGTENMERDNLKRICTNEYLQIKDFSNIWGGGDACHVKYCKTMEACPANALWAIKHGEYIGKNIARSIKKRPLKKFNYMGLGQTASLGIGKGMGELYGIQFTGWIAWVMRLFVFNYFMPLRTIMFNEISDWMFLLFRGQRKELWIERKQMEKERTFSMKQISLNKVA